MAKYIELIDKYRIEQGEGDYNPPSYVWVDNTGEVVRCKDCKWNMSCGYIRTRSFKEWKDWFCADGEREMQE